VSDVDVDKINEDVVQADGPKVLEFLTSNWQNLIIHELNQLSRSMSGSFNSKEDPLSEEILVFISNSFYFYLFFKKSSIKI
jgi:hypothetical protein